MSGYCIKIVQKSTFSEGGYFFVKKKYRNMYNYEDPKILIEVLSVDSASTLFKAENGFLLVLTF